MTTLTRNATIVRTIRDLRDAVAALRTTGRRIAFVPTMGALHEGHLSLARLAADDDHAVVMSIFVNPTQFAPTEDLDRYPRREAEDVRMAATAGVEIVFCPDAGEVYGDGHATAISVGGPSEGLEGAIRPGHFDGVATVVAKLLLMVRPDRLVLGQKDGQQIAVVRRLMADLHFDDVELVVGPIVRDTDGLAMSSRNAYLDAEERRAALALYRGLRVAEALAFAGDGDPRRLERAAIGEMSAQDGCRPEYAALVDPDTFHPVVSFDAPALLCVAARVGPARLIDNLLIHPATSATPSH